MTGVRRAAPWVLLGVVVAVLSGCGSTSPEASASPSIDLEVLPGDRVGELAEKQLEAEHQEMAVGTVTCPDLEWEVDASVRCEKLAELSDGRRVKIPGTVTVTSTAGYGRLHVELDDAVAEYGVDAAYLSTRVTAWVVARAQRTGTARCPYLPGKAGASVHCSARADGRSAKVRVSVTALHPTDFRTDYRMQWDPAPVAR